MTIKSTATDKSIRRDKDAPRTMHFGTLSFNPEFYSSINDKSILLYDDVCTWGNISEAVRNILLMSGASRVDLISVFSTEPVMRGAVYEYVGDGDVLDALNPIIPETFKLISSELVEKEYLKCENQFGEREWHELFGHWIEKNYPEVIPNDVPF